MYVHECATSSSSDNNTHYHTSHKSTEVNGEALQLKLYFLLQVTENLYQYDKLRLLCLNIQ